ncbi:nicotinate-nucleotide pyrophosphorylase (carboxylating) [Mariprofundus aestuarium]|uniref:Probable nicotinate-nucleotide pyrophosphorylase [carboxylating] n=1 Tax=Mariprofundus aestuarium TaxID=1921086 RepID=A0A2K8KWA8_MARES|nr:carboxylating nicotinate-nucleotide diphosphorylase [Mariprofundus aestuarium]ATX79165.1 nicotinate-nucleotide pyrophosphorylase (carboxylating) [Mariprofundus aestuarium]
MQTIHSQLIQIALDEDAAFNDLTGQATIAADATGCARISAKAAGVLSGLTVADEVFAKVDSGIARNWLVKDGDQVATGDTVCELTGPLRALLAAERTALNFLQHLSGIATATHSFVEKLEGTGCSVADTRKTTPGLRRLEKQAVIHGGGINHRINLESGMLIKENHIEACGSISDAIQACRSQSHDIWVEVECETMAEVHEAINASPDIILLDNMGPETVVLARELVPTSILLEASGNITLANARDYAETGIDRIAIGAITHSAPSLDLSMRIVSKQQ